MNCKQSILSAAIVASLGFAAQLHAQEVATAPADAATDLDTIVVTGIRGSIEKSLDVKREAKSHVEVITAEDIGKMPDKNVADSLQRLPGVTISSAGATEGGFDENDRVSMRGTNPSLTLTQINGHPVSSGDWFVLNQSDNAGRSVSYTLLPSSLVSQVLVHKTSQAKLNEGGVTGTVDIITRKPTEFAETFTASGSVGAVYATLPGETDPQINALLNFRNEASTFGVLVQAFSEDRTLRRDGVEVLGYDQIAPGSASPLAGVWYPRAIGAALFEQKRERRGGLVEVQFKPTDNLSFDLSGFVSKLDASNYNRNYLLYNPRILGAGQLPLPGYVVRNNTLVSAEFAPTPGVNTGLYDMISRPDESASTTYVAFEADWKASDKLNLDFKLGTSTGHGETPTQDVAEWTVGQGTGASYALNGIDRAPSFNLNDSTATPPANLALDWIFGLQNLDIEDKDTWGQIDAQYFIESGVFESLDFGVRVANHDRESANVVAQGPNWGASPFDPATFPQGYSNYPGDYASGLGGNFPRDIWYFTAEQMAAWNAVQANRDPVVRRYPFYDFSLEEKTQAAYVQANLSGDRWSGNVGVRLVKTRTEVLQYVPGGTTTTPGAIQGSAFGIFSPFTIKNDYTDVLPSANFRFELSDTLVARVAATRTMGRPDYSALAGGLNLSPPADENDVGGGNSSNPNLKPIYSNNYDAALEWYYAPRSLLSASVFYMDMSSYVSQGASNQQFLTFDAAHPDGYLGNYLVTSPINAPASAKGIELSWEQPLGEHFGFNTNYTYTDAEEDDGDPVVGASRNTFNLVGYFENEHFNARVAYNYRSHFYSGLDRRSAFNQDDTQSVSASVGWTFNDMVSVSLDGMNLSNEKLKYYADNKDQPRGIYNNGRQYYLNLRFKF
ncbi:TonB-dependent receptor [Pseudoxanthomonas gei]|uniref:TonB-dependent receptor n=1 Tax=Pseudoxanthomonas gei TaxID=1383030 RepID=A0ABX0AJN5_9GAMM|nr:TonB-dependent receptor [Pseudoxanthomonas gei]NDK39428.1 TonB-dependent receptor [Pseudoxanthomonas gei]